MKISDIYAAVSSGRFLGGDEAFLAQVAIELLAQVEGVPVPALDMSAPAFALAYPFETPAQLCFWHGASHYQAWRRTILDVQMRAVPGNTDGASWSSLARAERLFCKSSGARFYDLPLYLPATMQPEDVTDAVIRATYERLSNIKRPRFRAGVNAFRRLFDNDTVLQTGLLPLIKPQPLPGLRDHRALVPMAPDIERARSELFERSTRCTLDYVHRLAIAGGSLNGETDTLEDLRKALASLPNPNDVGVPEITDHCLHNYIITVMCRIGGRDYRLTEVEQAWKNLRKAAREAGCETSFLWALSKPASQQGIAPWRLTTAWVRQLIAGYKIDSMPAQCRRGCEQFDGFRSVVPPALLPLEPLSIRRSPPQKPKAPKPIDPVRSGWTAVYRNLRNDSTSSEGPSPLWYLKSEAIKAGLPPSGITQHWLETIRETCPLDRLHHLYEGVSTLRCIPGFEHISPLRKRRERHGGLPARIEDELRTTLDEMGVAAATGRKMLLAAGVLAEALGADDTMPLRDLVFTKLESVDWSAPERQITEYKGKIISLREFLALTWTPAWRELQGLVVGAGVGFKENPVPKVLGWKPGVDPQDISLEWARKLDRELRSTISRPPHGRADLARTLARHLAAFDRLHEIPSITASGLMPELIGAIR
ncbi:hypothetical protein [Leisingera sp. JC1]|uniref:hypothetical protein n=1 Tax=Leisingera sp. JC1 TaxID=1855282 RepID=UPI00080320F5|nr:hypothetical protein [Leisingera sp. JC1]OBY24571.1 hypothetical protein A9D60_24080 [Leisingera sp. JC1]